MAPSLVDLTLRCMFCGRFGRDPTLGGECVCGAENWEETSPPPAPPPAPPRMMALPATPPAPLILPRLSPLPAVPAAPPRMASPTTAPQRRWSLDGFVDGSEVPTTVVDDFVGARLNELLGGIMRGARLLIAGRAGAGKSTATAELAAFAAEHWARPEAGRLWQPGCKIYWLDADQKEPSLVRTLFQTAEVEHVFAQRGRVRLLPKRRTPFTFREALAMVPRDARVLVMDSLETWGYGGYKHQLDVMLALGDHPAMLKVMIAGTNKKGAVAGLEAIARADDATVYAERTEDGRYLLSFDKRRWRPCDSARARGAGKIIVPAPAPALPDQPFAPPPAPAPLPVGSSLDFSREFIAAAAATWGTREIEEYKAGLRAHGVPRESIDGWVAVFYEARENVRTAPLGT